MSPRQGGGKIVRVLCITLALLVGACANAGIEPAALEAPIQTGSVTAPADAAAGSRGEIRKVQHKAVEEALRPAKAFLAEKNADCLSPRLKEAASRITETAAALAAGMRAEYETMLEAGGAVLDVADGAKRRGCAQKARDLYEFVLKHFSGLGYAELRERASVGIREVKSKSQTGSLGSPG